MAKVAKGFTLLELMIVVAIIGILATFAYSNYNRYGFRARRTEGQQFLRSVAAAEERYFTTFNTYTSNITGASPGGLDFKSASSVPNGYYTVAITGLGATNTTYTLTATPQGGQVGDKCTSLILNNLGTQSIGPGGNETNGNCW